MSENNNNYSNNMWTINEMLPVIEEVQERLRRNTKDTESIHSTDSSSSNKTYLHKNSIGSVDESAKVDNNDKELSK